ncbi:MAG TPA: ABC transporter substrate-binding protein [Spirochaetia bacterium]|nr:ABC transporter substrate-binding protein [Spirochaetia bacterium]HRZ63698.1 ABC transporter substrate-binding protein [Spirochaetia bacterium]
MKKAVCSLALIAGLAIVLAGCGGGKASGGAAARANKGPIVDRILVSSKTQEDLAIKDVAEAKSDVFWYDINGATYKSLTDEVRGKLETYAVPSSYWSLLINPYPNAAPYVAKSKKDGKAAFNPFAIREVRFAMNLLINRKQMIDEIVSGAGLPKYSPVTLGQPNSGRYATIASKLGISETGDEAKALADIAAALEAAAELPENKGKLVKSGKWWSYAGKPVEINFLIRVDDPNGRLKEGRYVADQIEKAGLKVNRLEYDRSKCSSIYNAGDPGDYAWNIYTEGWGGGQTYAFWEGGLAQMYAPWFANMPGGGDAEKWNYQHPELDKLTQAAYNGIVKGEADYYEKCLEACELGIKEAVRVFTVDTNSYFLANKERFNGRMAYGIGDGLNRISALTADVKPDESGDYKGQKVLRVTEFSARGALFMYPWDPIGPDGFADTYGKVVSSPPSDMEFDFSPVTGLCLPLRASYKDFKAAPAFEGDKMVGTIPLPAEAVIWNALTQKWESGTVYVDKGEGSYGYAKAADKPEYGKAVASATFKYSYAKWHDGRMMDQNDYRYALALQQSVANKKGEGDKTYDESYAGSVCPQIARFKGFVFNKDGSITAYGDAYYPMDPVYNASLICPSLMIQASNYQAIVSWPVLEGILGLVAEGKYVVNSNGDYTEIDLLAEQCVADLKAKLQEYAAAKRVPAPLEGYLKPEDAVKAYESAIAFIEKYKHGYISNGGFILEKYDHANQTAVLAATPFADYPIAKGEMVKKVATTYARINSVKVGSFAKGSDLKVDVAVAEVAYPSNKAKAAAKANVKVTLVAEKDYAYEAKPAKAGFFAATIPAADLASLGSGTYTIVAEASLGAESGGVEAASLIVN